MSQPFTPIGLRRPCIDCGLLFWPTGRSSKLCEDCILERQRRSKKHKKPPQQVREEVKRRAEIIKRLKKRLKNAKL